MFFASDNGHWGALSYLCRIMMWDGYSALQDPDSDEVNLLVISMTQKTMKGAEFWLKLKFPQKLKPIIFCYDGLTLWTGTHLHIKCDSHYFMFSSANSASQHPSMFSSICLLSIDQPSRASVCLTSATSSSSSGNYLAALRRLLIFMSTCRNICFGMLFVNTTSVSLSRLVHFHSLSQSGFTPKCLLNWWLHCSSVEWKMSRADKYWEWDNAKFML